MSDYAFGLSCQLEKKLGKYINDDKLHVSDALERCCLDLQEMTFRMSVLARILRNQPVEAKNVFNDEIHYIRLSTADETCTKILEISTGGKVVDSLNDDDIVDDCDDECGCDCDEDEECLDCECDDCDGCEECDDDDYDYDDLDEEV